MKVNIKEHWCELNGWVFVYELSDCEFESSCSHITSDIAPASSKEFLDI